MPTGNPNAPQMDIPAIIKGGDIRGDITRLMSLVRTHIIQAGAERDILNEFARDYIPTPGSEGFAANTRRPDERQDTPGPPLQKQQLRPSPECVYPKSEEPSVAQELALILYEMEHATWRFNIRHRPITQPGPDDLIYLQKAREFIDAYWPEPRHPDENTPESAEKPSETENIVDCEVRCPDDDKQPVFDWPMDDTFQYLHESAGFREFRGYRIEKVRPAEIKEMETPDSMSTLDDGRNFDSLEYLSMAGYQVTHVCLAVSE